MEFQVGTVTLELVKGDITDVEADAIVNAANSSLLGGGGVDGAIHRKGGPKILEECKRIRDTEWPDGLPTGKAVLTSGGILKAKHVIHTVGPVWLGGFHVEGELLISTGAYGYPIEEASRVALGTVKDFLEKEDKPDKVIFVLLSEANYNVYVESAKAVFKK